MPKRIFMNTQELIKYIKSLGLKVNTSTKARGHLGFFLNNRIDISKNIPENKKAQILVHEFAHFVHSKIEPDMHKTGGNLNVIFNSDNPLITKELINVTHFVDKNSLCQKLEHNKQIIKEKILDYEKIIKLEYPKFQRSKKFKEFEKYIKKSDAKYLLKYDKVKLLKGFWSPKIKIYSINTIEKDFTNMPKPFMAYIRLKSYQKKLARISSKINKYKKYYLTPCELFARFIEGLYTDKNHIELIAPNAYKQFYSLINFENYKDLKNIL